MRKIREFSKRLKEGKAQTADKKADWPDVDRRMGPTDRRKYHTFISNDRRSGIADRRKKR